MQVKGWSGLLDRSYTSLSLESGVHVLSVTKSQDWICVVFSALFPSCSPHQPVVPSTHVLHLSSKPIRLFPHQSAFPTYLHCIAFTSPALFLVFFQPIISFPDLFSHSYPHLCFSASLHLHLIPSLVQFLFMSSLILLLCFFSPDIVFPWSCHVCLFLPLILNKLHALIFLSAILCDRVHLLCSSMTVIEGKHECICMCLSAGFTFKV